MTNLILPAPILIPHQLSYYDGENVFKVEDKYFLIAQCDGGKMILFSIADGMEWNREDDPVDVRWNSLTTESIKSYFPEFKDSVVERVNVKITFSKS